MIELSARLRAHVATLAPYGRLALERAGLQALRLHADEVGVEHLVGTLMEDESSAAHRAVVFAFADPETIAEEVRSLSAGIMVTGSAVSLPFSPGGVAALREARALGASRGQGLVELPHLVLGAAGALPEDLRAHMGAAGYEPAGVLAQCGPERPGPLPPAGGSLFRSFSDDAKRSLSASARLARQERAPAIAPSHLLLACLQALPALERAAGLSASRVRMLLRGRTLDEAPLPSRRLPPDDGLASFVLALPGGAGSLAMLARVHAGATPELAQLLARHKVTPALLERAAAAFSDPEA